MVEDKADRADILVRAAPPVSICAMLHHLFNVVTNQAEMPLAVLIRAGIPVTGTGRMLKRRNRAKVDKTRGRARLARQGVGNTIEHTGLSLMNGQIWIEDHGTDVADDAVTIGPRVGVDYAGEDALRPYRFRLSHTSGRIVGLNRLCSESIHVDYIL